MEEGRGGDVGGGRKEWTERERRREKGFEGSVKRGRRKRGGRKD